MEQEPSIFEPADVFEFDTLEGLDAVASPLRIRIMSCFREPGSIKEAAEVLGVRVTRLYHHVHRLVDQGFLVEVGERPSGKTVERLYSISAGTIRPSQKFIDTYGAEGGIELMRLAFRTAETDVITSIESDPRLQKRSDRHTVSYTRVKLDETSLKELITDLEELTAKYRAVEDGDIEVAFFGVAVPIVGEP